MVEDALLDLFVGIRPEEMLPAGQSQDATKLATLTARIDKTTANIATWEMEALDGQAGLSRLISQATVQLETLENERKALLASMAVAKVDVLGQMQSLSSALAKLEGDEQSAARAKLSARSFLALSNGLN